MSGGSASALRRGSRPRVCCPPHSRPQGFPHCDARWGAATIVMPAGRSTSPGLKGGDMGSSARGEAKGVGSLTAWRGLLYAAALLSMPLVAWDAQAQSCPGGAYLCPNQDGCCYTGTICGTGSNGCPADSCCPAGGGGSSGGGGGTCGPGQEPCAGRCMPAGAVCCGPQGYCEAGQVCTSVSPRSSPPC